MPRAHARATLLAITLAFSAACATAPRLPPPDVVQQAQGASSYSAELGVSLRGPDLRGRATILAGFRRPDRLRLELPGPGGARLVVVVAGDRATAVFPRERAVWEGAATPQALGEVTGVSLSAPDIMNLLVGIPPASMVGFRADWGPRLPSRVRGTLSDGTRLDARIKDPRAGAALPDAAFQPPPHEGYRAVGASEARDLWVVRR
jgi:outer membrane lipoprotein-sorting protein